MTLTRRGHPWDEALSGRSAHSHCWPCTALWLRPVEWSVPCSARESGGTIADVAYATPFLGLLVKVSEWPPIWRWLPMARPSAAGRTLSSNWRCKDILCRWRRDIKAERFSCRHQFAPASPTRAGSRHANPNGYHLRIAAQGKGSHAFRLRRPPAGRLRHRVRRG